MIASLTTIILLAVVTGAALTDIKDRTIPNALTYCGVLLGLALGVYNGVFVSSVLGLAMGLIPGIILWKKFELGAGDAKLFAAVGALSGATFTLYVWLWAFALAMVVVFYRAIQARVFWVTVRALLCGAVSPLIPPLRNLCVLSPKLAQTMPMAPCIALATALMVATGGVL